jgi:hypothetical protein
MGSRPVRLHVCRGAGADVSEQDHDEDGESRRDDCARGGGRPQSVRERSASRTDEGGIDSPGKLLRERHGAAEGLPRRRREPGWPTGQIGSAISFL